MTETYRITNTIHCCGDSHAVCIDQLEMFTHILLLTRVRERKRRESQKAYAVCVFSFLHAKMDAFSLYIWISNQPPQLLPSTTALKLCEAHKKQKFYHFNPCSILQLFKISIFRPIIS